MLGFFRNPGTEQTTFCIAGIQRWVPCQKRDPIHVLRLILVWCRRWVKTNVLSCHWGIAGILYRMQRVSLELSDGFASIVEKYRKSKGLSRATLATMAGLHQTYIGLLERGKRSPNLDTAQAIARGLGFSLSKLIIEAEKIQKRKPSK